jgi:hypothetical protein
MGKPPAAVTLKEGRGPHGEKERKGEKREKVVENRRMNRAGAVGAAGEWDGRWMERAGQSPEVVWAGMGLKGDVYTIGSVFESKTGRVVVGGR